VSPSPIAPTDSFLPAAVAETHISVLVFVGDRAYKLKKPVQTAFLDFSTRELREAACHGEVELNRRLAPDVYLGVADVAGPDGRVCDHLVLMRRLPAERRLSTLALAGADVEEPLRALAHQLAAFHTAAPRSPEIDAAATAGAVRRRWERNFGEMSSAVGDVFDLDLFTRVEELALRYVAGREPLFDDRIAAGHIVDGHGDLLAEDIFCLDDGPRAIDCIEFDDRLRYNDVVADVAFLAMDLEDLGAPGPAQRFLATYRELTGDRWPRSLEHHYTAERAVIRAKVAMLRHRQTGAADHSDAARRRFGLAARHLEAGRVRLVVVGGLPGAGKSTLAAALSDATGWTVLRSDEVRKDLAGLGHYDRNHAGYGEGLYRPEHTAATYAELLARARVALTRGESVILDASWTSADERSAARSLARTTSSDLAEIECRAPAEMRAAHRSPRRRRGRCVRRHDGSGGRDGVGRRTQGRGHGRRHHRPTPGHRRGGTGLPPRAGRGLSATGGVGARTLTACPIGTSPRSGTASPRSRPTARPSSAGNAG
jgi:uncharacterized protein